jgi:hypothetical protein
VCSSEFFEHRQKYTIIHNSDTEGLLQPQQMMVAAEEKRSYQ